MKYLKLFEAKANPVRNEKLKLLKRKVNGILPSANEVKDVIFRTIFTKEYNNICDSYIIPRMDTIEAQLQRSINLNDKTDKYKSFVFVSTNTYTPTYGSNYAGICRLLNDYYIGKVTPVIFNEISDFDGDGKTKKNVIEIKPSFSLFLDVDVDLCDIMFYYGLNWAYMHKIKIHDNSILKKDGLSKKDVLDFLEIECKKFKEEKIDLYLFNFESEFNKIKNILINEVSGSLNYKKATILCTH